MIEDNQVKMEGDFEHLKSQGLDFDAMLKTYEKKEEEDKVEDEFMFEEDEEEQESVVEVHKRKSSIQVEESKKLFIRLVLSNHVTHF